MGGNNFDWRVVVMTLHQRRSAAEKLQQYDTVYLER